MRLDALTLVATALLAGWAASPVQAADVAVAVTASFAAPMREIAVRFKRATRHTALLADGSTGKFNAQIRNGAPFDVFLAADQRTPQSLAADGFGSARSQFTYATGRLALWSAQPNFVDRNGEVLRRGNFRRLALADPKLAPFGAAALETLNSLGLTSELRNRWVLGESVAQVYQFVLTGNAQLGFVALSQVVKRGTPLGGSVWVVPDHLHRPIRQDALLLNRAGDNPAALALMEFLRGPIASKILSEYGYR